MNPETTELYRALERRADRWFAALPRSKRLYTRVSGLDKLIKLAFMTGYLAAAREVK